MLSEAPAQRVDDSQAQSKPKTLPTLDTKIKTNKFKIYLFAILLIAALSISGIYFRILDNLPSQIFATATVTPTSTPYPTITPTTTPRPTPSPTMTEEPYSFTDDFNSALKPKWDTGSGSRWEIHNNRLELLESESKAASIAVGALESRNYTVSFEAGGFEKFTLGGLFPKLEEEPPPKSLIIIVRATRNKSGDIQGGLFRFSSYHYQCGSYYDNNLSDIPLELQFFGWQGPYDVIVNVKNDNYAFYLNDKRVCTFQTDRFSKGPVLLIGTDGKGNMIWIDNFTLIIED